MKSLAQCWNICRAEKKIWIMMAGAGRNCLHLVKPTERERSREKKRERESQRERVREREREKEKVKEK